MTDYRDTKQRVKEMAFFKNHLKNKCHFKLLDDAHRKDKIERLLQHSGRIPDIFSFQWQFGGFPFSRDCSTAFTLKEDVPSFDGYQGNKEQRNIIIGPHGPHLTETTSITPFSRLVQGDGSGLYAPYEKKHFTPV